MKKILVLGGGGFIGRNLVASLLLENEVHVIAADIKSESDCSKFAYELGKDSIFEEIIGDFSKAETFSRLPRDIAEIYMLAAIVGVNRTLKFPDEVIRTNTNLTMNTLDWVRSNPVQKIIFASSSENYAGTTDLFDSEIPTPETVPLCISDIQHPRWTYAISKIHGESAFLHSATPLGFQCSIIRYQNIIGPEMGFGHAIPHIVERFMNKNLSEAFEIYGHDQTRAFCFVKDAVEGTIGAMKNKNSHGQIYHIGNDEEITIDSLTRHIGSYIGYSGKYVNAPTYPGSVSRRCPNISKARTDLNYEPQYEWQRAVELTVDWYKEYFLSGKKPINGGFEPPENVVPTLN